LVSGTENEEEVRLKGTSVQQLSTLNACIFGGTNVGKTYFLLSYVRSQKKRMIFINADVEENFIRNYNTLTQEQKRRIIQPHKANVSGIQMGDIPSIRKIVHEILEGPIQNLINSGQIELIAIDSIDTILNVYEGWYFNKRKIDNPTPFDYGRARDIFEREFLLPLLRQPCHFLCTSNYSVVYPSNQQFAQPIMVNISGRMLPAHQPKVPSRFWKHFTTIFELRQVDPFVKRDVDAFFIKSKEYCGLYNYIKLPKANKKGIVFADYFNYIKSVFEANK